MHVLYRLAAAFLIPDVVFYLKLVSELVNWDSPDPSWAQNDWSCGLWQFASHWYPLLYAVLLLAIVYHAFLTLFLDCTGRYEEKCRNNVYLVVLALVSVTAFIVTPSAIYSTAKEESAANRPFSHFRQYCDLEVPSLLSSKSTEAMKLEAVAAYRLVYEVILPYILPLIFMGFPYVCLLIGLMRGAAATAHADHAVKMTVVVTLWLVTTYLMLHVSSVMRAVFSSLSVWHRLVAMFDAYEDERVPRFQTAIHISAYSLTCLWGIIRPILCFKYNVKLRKALGP